MNRSEYTANISMQREHAMPWVKPSVLRGRHVTMKKRMGFIKSTIIAAGFVALAFGPFFKYIWSI